MAWKSFHSPSAREIACLRFELFCKLDTRSRSAAEYMSFLLLIRAYVRKVKRLQRQITEFSRDFPYQRAPSYLETSCRDTKWEGVDKTRLLVFKHYKMLFVLSSFHNILTSLAISILRGTATIKNAASLFLSLGWRECFLGLTWASPFGWAGWLFDE